jgi:hypothetical protein
MVVGGEAWGGGATLRTGLDSLDSSREGPFTSILERGRNQPAPTELATDEEVRGLPLDLADRLDAWASNMVERLG